MNLVYLGFGICCGVAIGYLMRAALDPSLEQENRALREGLRYVRGACAGSNVRGVTRYIDALLQDEAA